MNQTGFNRRQLMALMGSAAVAAGLPGSAVAQDAALKFWDEIAEEGEVHEKVVKVFRDYNEVIGNAGPPYSFE